ncbi:hypothetical protein TIFTF001_049193 [Ficus carica]|uniref:Uncharacterized protein n=1 Tax=Ficus carica TaxID=3494 RepID=A0AA87ZJ17_FICCA|nr:hypothetical protein TIFTF001_049193 [Ficus carica]
MAPFLVLVPFLELIPQGFGLWPPSWNLLPQGFGRIWPMAPILELASSRIWPMAPILEPLLLMAAPILEFPPQGFGRLR